MIEQVVDTSLVNVVIGQVLESSVVDFVVTTFVLDLVSARLVNRNTLDFAEAEFFARFQIVDGVIAGGLNVADHGVRKNGLVRIPFLDCLVVVDLQVKRKNHLLANGHVLEGVFIEV